jgi:asparagine synthase (glutamine-hydrolysing)
MCGIAGIIGLSRERAEPALTRMRDALGHRGPDGRGMTFLGGHGQSVIGLAHTRLAIIDVSAAGAQPMTDATCTRTITFNGEIFNYRSLADDLALRGHAVRGRTDTEVILHAYTTWGTDAAQRLRGMFAFAIADADTQRVWLCRDRIGIKPLYVAHSAAGGLLFASEVRALLAAGRDLLPPRLSRAALEGYLAQGMVTGLDAIIDGVSELAPGTSLVVGWDGRELQRRSYWTLPINEAPHVWSRRDDQVDAVERALDDAVNVHLVSDVPLGVFLSSGIDSAAIATLAARAGGHTLRTVSIGFDERTHDESHRAELIARELGTEHTTVRLSGDDMLADIGHVFAALDQPTVDGFNSYFVSRAARQAGLTVALSGVGGDELFGGYASFTDVPRARAFAGIAARAPGAVRSAAVAALEDRRSRSLVKAAELLRRSNTPASAYLLRRELFLPRERRLLHQLPDTSDPDTGLPIAVLAELGELHAHDDRANQVSGFEMVHYLRSMLLRDADVFSMANSLELRVPLLDHHLVELVMALPGRWKRRHLARAKPLLLDAVGSRMPGGVERSKKRGFTFPWNAWLRGPLRSSAMKIMAELELWRTLNLNPDAPARLWNDFLGGSARVSALQIVALWVLAEVATRYGAIGVE